MHRRKWILAACVVATAILGERQPPTIWDVPYGKG